MQQARHPHPPCTRLGTQQPRGPASPLAPPSVRAATKLGPAPAQACNKALRRIWIDERSETEREREWIVCVYVREYVCVYERETVRESKRRNKLCSCCTRASERDRNANTERQRDRRRERERREEETTIDLSTGRSINHSPCSWRLIKAVSPWPTTTLFFRMSIGLSSASSA